MSVSIPSTSEPPRNRRRAEQRNVLGERVETCEREMIGVRMSQQKRIDGGKVSNRDPRSAYPREETSKASSKMWIRENTDPVELEQQGCVADVCNPKGRDRTLRLVDSRRSGLGIHRRGTDAVRRARSRAMSHCCGRAAKFCTA